MTSLCNTSPNTNNTHDDSTGSTCAEPISIMPDVENTRRYCNIISQLCDTYKADKYALKRLDYYMTDFLHKAISTDAKRNCDKIQFNLSVVDGQDEFYKLFLQKHQYYYLPSVSCFYEYYNDTYSPIKEDDVQYELLCELGMHPILSQCRHKTKQTLIKRIKDRHLFRSIPNSTTIQSILRIIQLFLFETKCEAKYFLTILGDRILKKDTSNIIYYVDKYVKKFVSILDQFQPQHMQYNSHIFVTKYHDLHTTSNYRVLYTHKSHFVNTDDMQKYCSDIMCVAVHYSNRYSCAESYMKLYLSKSALDRVLYAANHTQDDVIRDFASNSIEYVNTQTVLGLSWKNMHYIWKQYLSTHNIPNIMYVQTFREKIMEMFHYSDLHDKFIGVTSKQTPCISAILNFWDTHMHLSNNAEDEYELSEIVWAMKKDGIVAEEQLILDVLGHFYTDTNNVVIIDDKFVKYVKCDLLDKERTIRDTIDTYMSQNPNTVVDRTCVIELYEYYLAHVSNMNEIACSTSFFKSYIERTYNASCI